MASEALAEGFDNLMWIDSDIEFHPLTVNQLLAHGLPIVGGIYAVKGKRRLACKALEGTDQLVFGQDGGLVELEHLATGFFLTKASVYRKIQEQFRLPTCIGGKHGLIPFFQPMVVQRPQTGEHVYLSEGFSFCERARHCGFKVMADTTIRLGHIGKRSYSWEDAGSTTTRYESYRYRLK